jgi:hypothetical protein
MFAIYEHILEKNCHVAFIHVVVQKYKELYMFTMDRLTAVQVVELDRLRIASVQVAKLNRLIIVKLDRIEIGRLIIVQVQVVKLNRDKDYAGSSEI